MFLMCRPWDDVELSINATIDIICWWILKCLFMNCQQFGLQYVIILWLHCGWCGSADGQCFSNNSLSCTMYIWYKWGTVNNIKNKMHTESGLSFALHLFITITHKKRQVRNVAFLFLQVSRGCKRAIVSVYFKSTKSYFTKLCFCVNWP